MQIIHKQRGISIIMTLFFIVCLLLVGTLALRLTPIYITNHTVKSILTSLQAAPQIQEVRTTRQLKATAKDLIMKRLAMNNIRHINNQNIQITTANNSIAISIKYQTRTRFFSNIDLIATFDDSVKVTLP